MQDEYDFSHAMRGKFYRKSAVITASIQVEADVLTQLSELSEKTGKSHSELISDMLKRESGSTS
jgi:hypothetical protein